MLIASKYEDIYAPEISDFVYITDKAYTREQILQQEYEILSALDYDITFPSPLAFLNRLTKLHKIDNLCYVYSKYLIELTIIDCKYLKWYPS